MLSSYKQGKTKTWGTKAKVSMSMYIATLAFLVTVPNE